MTAALECSGLARERLGSGSREKTLLNLKNIYALQYQVKVMSHPDGR
jgi:hypothetical protein